MISQVFITIRFDILRYNNVFDGSWDMLIVLF